MEAKNKKAYLDAWKNHIADFNTLTFCRVPEHRAMVREGMAKLTEALELIADTKYPKVKA